MHKNAIDLTGQKFSKLTVIKEHGRTKKNLVTWLCICECGKEKVIAGTPLRIGATHSCGCYQKQRVRETQVTHGQSKKGNISSEYRCWLSIKSRCYNKNNKRFKDWGGRGIKMCDRWLESFDNFIQDVGKKPTRNHSLDRFPNNDGHYEPNNCRWATRKQQNRGMRSNQWLSYEGKTMVAKDWATYFGIVPSCIYNMLKNRSSNETIEFFINKYGK